jgi:hypothetical protein
LQGQANASNASLTASSIQQMWPGNQGVVANKPQV